MQLILIQAAFRSIELLILPCRMLMSLNFYLKLLKNLIGGFILGINHPFMTLRFRPSSLIDRHGARGADAKACNCKRDGCGFDSRYDSEKFII